VNPLADLPTDYKRHEPISPLETTLADWMTCIRPDGKIVWLRGDPDVMDTWATSSISPQLSAHGITAELTAEPERFASLFPADLRPQAHEIIRTWAFYTLVKAHLHNDQIPWKNLMISGWCLAEDKSKMSKSKGNVVTPIALIEERGADAVRYWAGTSRLGQDTAFSPDLLKIGKKLVGKLWNATQFAAIHLSKLDHAPTTAATDAAITETLDRWILARLHETVAQASTAFARYEYADALDATNQFFWADFCDNYLELIKKRVYNEDGSASPAAQQSAIRALYYVLDGILKLYAPFVPHVTEELYTHIFADEAAARGSLHAMGQWPQAARYPHDVKALEMGELTKLLLEDVRKHKSEAKRSIKTTVTQAKIYISTAFLAQAAEVASVAYDLKGAGNIEQLEWLPTANASGAAKVELTLTAEADAA
jgi:valyl-tRNA synthetase